MAYQRGRLMSGPGVMVLVSGSNTSESLFARPVVAVPFQLSPPARNTSLLRGSTICAPQNRSVVVVLGSVRWPRPRPARGSQMS